MFTLSDSPFDRAALHQQMASPQAGAFAVFEGWVRNQNEGKSVTSLVYEAYEALAVKEGNRILESAKAQFAILNAVCVHRTGHLEVGELAVWVGVTARHRKEAFAACRHIIDTLKHRLPIWKQEHYGDGEAHWIDCQACHVSSAEIAMTEEDYYHRQLRLPQVGTLGQARLKQAKVLVIGAGGLGAPALLYLAAAGVGTLGICEDDVLDTSNLHRQILYTADTVGQSKAQLAKDSLIARNPFIHVTVHPDRFHPGNAAELLVAYDLVLDCTDNFQTRLLLNETAVRLQKPLIQAAVQGFEGQLYVTDPAAGSPCLRCMWPALPDEACPGACGEEGILGAVAGVLGSMQALEALKWILQVPNRLSPDQFLAINLLDWRMQTIRRVRNPLCPVCSDASREVSLPAVLAPSPLLSWEEIGQKPSDTWVWVDLREPGENSLPFPLPDANCLALPWSVFTPDLLAGNTRLRYVLFCQHGIRSRILAEKLQAQGLTHVYALAGGMDSLPPNASACSVGTGDFGTS